MDALKSVSVSAFLVFIFAALLSLHFFLQPLRPLCDQGWILQAAARDSAGKGLTTSMNSSLDDLTSLQYERLVYFPPLFPLGISWLLRTGLSVDAAVKMVNLLSLLTGTIGWTLLA